MTTLDLSNVREEICMILRNYDILSTTIRGVTTQTDSFTATAGQTVFTLTKTTGLRNIRSVTVDSVAKYAYSDYTIQWSANTITFGTGIGVGLTVVIVYDYGTSDKIFPDYPRGDLSLTSFPRIGMQVTSMRTEPLGLGGMTHMSDVLLTVYVWIPTNKDSSVGGGKGGTEDLSDLITSIRTSMRAYAKSFKTFNYVTPVSVGPIIKGDYDKIMQQNADFKLMIVVE